MEKKAAAKAVAKVFNSNAAAAACLANLIAWADVESKHKAAMEEAQAGIASAAEICFAEVRDYIVQGGTFETLEAEYANSYPHTLTSRSAGILGQRYRVIKSRIMSGVAAGHKLTKNTTSNDLTKAAKKSAPVAPVAPVAPSAGDMAKVSTSAKNDLDNVKQALAFLTINGDARLAFASKIKSLALAVANDEAVRREQSAKELAAQGAKIKAA